MRYGIPYMGSKNKIARWVVSNLPPAEFFVDLFAGGCAVTHAAMLSGNYERFIANDITDAPKLFVDAANGKYRDESRWISREDFETLKATGPYVRYCWSFGNCGTEYLYSKEIEPFKKWLHHMFFAKDAKEARLYWRKFVAEFRVLRDEIARLTEAAEDLCAECGVPVKRSKDGTIDASAIKKDVFVVKSAGIRNYMRDALKKSGRTAADVDRLLGTNGMAGHYFGRSQWALPTAEAYRNMRSIMPDLTIPYAELHESLQSLERLQSLESLERLQSLESLQSLERLERLQSLESLERLERLQSLERLQKDYRCVDIPDDAVVYCDIPYIGTKSYEAAFDHAGFYDWLSGQDRMVIVSEYTAPPHTVEIARIDKRQMLNGKGSGAKKQERLFVNERFVDEYYGRMNKQMEPINA